MAAFLQLQRQAEKGMTRLLKTLHKWVGLLIGLQVMAWLLSGLAISLLDPAKVSGQKWARTNHAVIPALGAGVFLEPAELPAEWRKSVLGLDLITNDGRPVYRIRRADGEILVDAVDGSAVTTSREEAAEIARQDFAGNGEIVSIEHGMAPDRETRDSRGAYWRVNFSDPANTAIYVSESSGKILERRNRHWRVRDFFWMLHIMDYPGREDINNPLVMGAALIAVWLGLSGILLLFASFKRHDFFFLNVLGARDTAIITLHDPAAEAPRRLNLRKGSNLFLTLATHDINLPSICGGGGECGKCRVRFDGDGLPEANDVEMGLVPKRLREQGYRLACQHEVAGEVAIHLPANTLKRKT
jgi:Na+-transporting NADH:ubiquinone oxidoreductase subunit F